MILAPAQREALRRILAIWGCDDVALTGAAALGAFLDMRWRETAETSS